jgi:hypothetical protein
LDLSLANQYIPTLQRVIEAVHFARRQYSVAMIAGAHFLLFSREALVPSFATLKFALDG